MRSTFFIFNKTIIFFPNAADFPALPFSLRQVPDERACRVGVAEAMRHELLVPYPVMQGKCNLTFILFMNYFQYININIFSFIPVFVS